MKIKKGHQVKIISGKYKGSKGKVLSVCQKTNKVTIENFNIKTKHVKPKRDEEKGYIKKIEGPIHQSNIKIDNLTN
uniref:Large ribosomal subunit protein uL24c n=1 Tax=Polysiphonia infestans TaxID=2006978 RepID=A0A1Z1MEF0_9FLOR|nr:ribosomal protein L24 [Polysiphonia infestans]ARW64410.1 ribosomal protein L24 [Polysiphonia infestans]